MLKIKIQIIIIMIFLSFLFSACVKKEIVFENKLICNKQLKIDRPKVVLRVKKADMNVALAFKEALNSNFEFYENQVNQNNKLCKEMENANIK